jgi:hypothetical protein
MMRWDAEGSRNRRFMIPISLGFFGRSMSKFNQQLLEMESWPCVRTIDVGRAVEVYPQYTPS